MPTTADITVTLPASASADFWRSQPANALPNGVADDTEDINHRGLVGIGPGWASAIPPVATLDVAQVGRSGVDSRVPGVTPLYVTGNLPGIGDVTTPGVTPVGGAEIKHTNNSQGVGFAYDGIYATGSGVNQALHFMNRGAGIFQFIHQTLNGGQNYFDKVSAALAVNQGWTERYFAGSIQKMAQLHRQSANGVGGTLGMETFYQRTDAAGAFRNAFYMGPSATNAQTFSFMVDQANLLNDAKIVLWGFNTNAFFGFGVKGSTLAYFINGTSSFHRWYQGNSTLNQMIFSVSGQSVATVDPSALSGGLNGAGALRFGSEVSSAFITSRRDGAGNNNGLNFGTSSIVRYAIHANGFMRFNYHGTPNNAATNDTFTNTTGSTGFQARYEFDDAGTGGGEQSPFLAILTENCGAPCGQAFPDSIVLGNRNTSSNQNGIAGIIAWKAGNGVGANPTVAWIGSNRSGRLDLAANTDIVQSLTGAAGFQQYHIVAGTAVPRIFGLLVAATDVAAAGLGLVAGDLYRTVTGEVRVKL